MGGRILLHWGPPMQWGGQQDSLRCERAPRNKALIFQGVPSFTVSKGGPAALFSLPLSQPQQNWN